MNNHFRRILAGLLLLFPMFSNGQFLMDMIDTTKDAGKRMLGIYKKFDHLRFSGYIQPQFEVAAGKKDNRFSSRGLWNTIVKPVQIFHLPVKNTPS